MLGSQPEPIGWDGRLLGSCIVRRDRALGGNSSQAERSKLLSKGLTRLAAYHEPPIASPLGLTEGLPETCRLLTPRQWWARLGHRCPPCRAVRGMAVGSPPSFSAPGFHPCGLGTLVRGGEEGGVRSLEPVALMSRVFTCPCVQGTGSGPEWV